MRVIEDHDHLVSIALLVGFSQRRTDRPVEASVLGQHIRMLSKAHLRLSTDQGKAGVKVGAIDIKEDGMGTSLVDLSRDIGR
jgi:hypothetical protein